jgi:hypothetical protein
VLLHREETCWNFPGLVDDEGGSSQLKNAEGTNADGTTQNDLGHLPAGNVWPAMSPPPVSVWGTCF